MNEEEEFIASKEAEAIVEAENDKDKEMKLKTLKDCSLKLEIGFKSDEYAQGFNQGQEDLKNIERQEAIKHIKNIKEKAKEAQEKNHSFENIIIEDAITHWIIYFFNITEEDLK